MSPLSKLCMYHYGRIFQILSKYYESFWRSDSVKISSKYRWSSAYTVSPLTTWAFFSLLINHSYHNTVFCLFFHSLKKCIPRRARLVYFLPNFLKTISWFSKSLLQKILSCMVSIQERFVIKSRLWWRGYSILPLSIFYLTLQ